MTIRPAHTNTGTARRLAKWLAAHMTETRLSVTEVAHELGIAESIVRALLAGTDPRPPFAANEFGHLDTPVRLGAWLRARIADSGQSVKEIADSTNGVSMGTIYNWLKGKHLPPPPTGDEFDRFDALLRNPHLDLTLPQRVQLDEIRRRLTGTSLTIIESAPDWPVRALPDGNRSFTGRANELRRLDRLLYPHVHGKAVVISALTGIGGVGKTALAVHWARTRDVRTTFTDGCLYINLRGYAAAPPLSADTAIRKLLLQLGADPKAVSADADAATAMYQEALVGKRLLVVLDNAHAAPQVRPLLPADPLCLAIITSRDRLHGLDVTDGGITHLPIDALSDSEAASLVRNLLGRLATRSTSDEDISAFTEVCGHLPLAIQIAAANYLTHAHPKSISVGEYVQTLERNRLDALAIGPSDPAIAIATTMDHSYRHLSDLAQRTYRLLGLHPGPDFTAPSAISLTGLPASQMAGALTELAQANLVAEGARGRYALHDLIREHAANMSHQHDQEDRRDAATTRMLDHYLHSAHAVARVIDPHRISIELDPPRHGVAPEVLTDHGQAQAWAADEYPVLLAAIAYASATGHDAHTWKLAWTLSGFLNRRGLWQEMLTTGLAAVAAAQRSGDEAARAHAHRLLSSAYSISRKFEDALDHGLQALELYRKAGDVHGQSHTHHTLAGIFDRKGQAANALDHVEQALTLHRAIGHRAGEARALNSIGWYHALLGDYQQAVDLSGQALPLLREFDDLTGQAAALDTLGYACHHLGRHHEAITQFEQSIELCRRVGNRYGEAASLNQLGDTRFALGDIEAACSAWHHALDLFTELDHSDAIEVHRKLQDAKRRPH